MVNEYPPANQRRIGSPETEELSHSSQPKLSYPRSVKVVQ